MKHKHAELIKAWADGAEIEWKMPHQTTWSAVGMPTWSEGYEYRIKPKQPVVRWEWAYKGKTIKKWMGSGTFFTDAEAAENLKDVEHIKLEYTRTEFPE